MTCFDVIIVALALDTITCVKSVKIIMVKLSKLKNTKNRKKTSGFFATPGD